MYFLIRSIFNTLMAVFYAFLLLYYSYFFQMCQFLPFIMRIKSEFESRMTSVERIVEYAYVSLPSESSASFISSYNVNSLFVM